MSYWRHNLLQQEELITAGRPVTFLHQTTRDFSEPVTILRPLIGVDILYIIYTSLKIAKGRTINGHRHSCHQILDVLVNRIQTRRTDVRAELVYFVDRVVLVPRRHFLQ